MLMPRTVAQLACLTLFWAAPASAQTAADYDVQYTGQPGFNCSWEWFDPLADPACSGTITNLTDDGSHMSVNGALLNMCGMSFNFLGDT
jgi:hypothetical protein